MRARKIANRKAETVATRTSPGLRPFLVFGQPQRLFVELKDRWNWGLAYFYGAVGLLIGNLLTLEQMQAFEQIRNSGQELPVVIATAAKIAVALAAYISPFTTPLIQAYVMAFVAQVMSSLLSVRVRFSKLYSLVLHCTLPSFICGAILKAILAHLIPPSMISGISIGPEVFLPPNYSGWIRTFLMSLDLLNLWFLGLFILGYGIVHRVPVKKSLIVTAGLYGLTLLQALIMSSVR